MDPDQTLKEIIDAAVAGDRRLLMERALDLSGWLLQGGFAPSDPRVDSPEAVAGDVPRSQGDPA